MISLEAEFLLNKQIVETTNDSNGVLLDRIMTISNIRIWEKSQTNIGIFEGIFAKTNKDDTEV